MTTNIDGGGPAFPEHFIYEPDKGVAGEYCGTGDALGRYGLSIRDYFAARAMQAIISKGMDAAIAKLEESRDYSSDDIVEILENKVALSAYRFADAMLAARKRRPNDQRTPETD